MIGYWGKLESTFFATVSQEKKAFLLWSYVLRKERNCMEKEIMQGTTSGQTRGRPRTRWQDNITKWTGLTGDRLLRSVEDRRKIIHEAANPRIEDGWRYKLSNNKLDTVALSKYRECVYHYCSFVQQSTTTYKCIFTGPIRRELPMHSAIYVNCHMLYGY